MFETINIDRANQFANVARVQLRSPHLSLTRTKEGRLDFERYMYQRKVIKAVKSTPWDYALDEISLEDGKVGLVDEVPSQRVALNLDLLNLTIGDLTSDPKHKNTISFSTRINDKGSLKIQSDVIR